MYISLKSLFQLGYKGPAYINNKRIAQISEVGSTKILDSSHFLVLSVDGNTYTMQGEEMVDCPTLDNIAGKSSSRQVWFNYILLGPAYSQKIRNHSPDGFNWGYGGSGPAQLALAILLQSTLNTEVTRLLYQQFKWEFVARWAQNKDFEVQIDITEWIRTKINKGD